ncbi:hypothetical protein PAHAL_7G021500 [Panicum hallii]|uniref:Uncharacterized protein n=1 Tax=Panicum hallii TaxID=206008 RepID=A0A2T8IAQ2_9POAL|nr:hypothetical protein PAHAL_7G021500 [Panicum hallii]
MLLGSSIRKHTGRHRTCSGWKLSVCRCLFCILVEALF